MTLPHHDAAHSNERRRRETPLLGTEQAGDRKIATSAELAVGLDRDAATEVVEDKRLMGLRQTELPWQTSVLDASPARRTSATVVARDENVVRLGLGHTTGDDPYADLGYELDGHTRSRV